MKFNLIEQMEGGLSSRGDRDRIDKQERRAIDDALLIRQRWQIRIFGFLCPNEQTGDDHGHCEWQVQR